MKNVYLIYDEYNSRNPKLIAIVSSEKKAIEYCSTEGRTRFYKDQNLFGNNRGGYCMNPLRYEKHQVL